MKQHDDEKYPISLNVKRLIALRMSILAIPPGTENPMKTGMQAILEPEKLSSIAKEATEWVKMAINLVKTSPDNPYGNNDEMIADAILRKLDKAV